LLIFSLTSEQPQVGQIGVFIGQKCFRIPSKIEVAPKTNCMPTFCQDKPSLKPAKILSLVPVGMIQTSFFVVDIGAILKSYKVESLPEEARTRGFPSPPFGGFGFVIATYLA
jgi:hypothetical protein